MQNLSEYQRFISYLYEYQNNQKSKNCGFSRVEIRNQQCRLEVHMKLPPYPFLPKLQVFAFVHENDQLLGIPLGNANCHQGTVYGRYMLPLKNIGGFPYSFEDLGGLLICTDNNQIFGTAWKETVLNPSLFTLAEDDSQIQAASVKEIETPEKEKPWKILLRQILPSPFGKKFKLLIHKYTLFLMMKSTNAWNYPHKISLIWQKNPSTLAVTSFLPASIRLITTSCWENAAGKAGRICAGCSRNL